MTLFKNQLFREPANGKLSNIWQYDSFQICLDPLHNGKPTDLNFSDDDFEYSLGLRGNEPLVYRRTGSSMTYDSLLKAPGIVRDVKLTVQDSPGKRIFTAAFPRQTVSPFHLRPGELMRSSIIVNLYKNGKRFAYLELTPGIGGTKSPGKWMDTILLP